MDKFRPQILEEEEIPVAWYTLFSVLAVAPELEKGVEAAAETVFIVLIGLIINLIGAFLFAKGSTKSINNIGIVLLVISFLIVISKILFWR